MLTRKRTKAWDMQSEPSAADKYVYHHELDGHFYAMSLKQTEISCLERIYTGYIDERADRKR